MRFCPECGTPVVAGAKYCVECGQPLMAGQAPVEGLPPQAIPRAGVGLAFVAVFAIIVIAGLGAIYFIRRQTPEPQTAPVANSGVSGAEQQLPPGHPQIELPAEARKMIEDLRHKAEAKPNDLALWNRLGEVLFRASQLDAVYSQQAMDAYGHVLKIDPENLDALRGVGNVDYDRANYDQAIAAYEHYLKKKPDDADVRTDLGTMYLYTGNADQALVQYKKVIAQKPNFFEAYFNMGVAYTRVNDAAKASEAFDHAIKAAPDEQTRARIKEAIAKVTGNGAALANEQAAAGGAPAPASAPVNTFEGAIENMLRGIRFMGPKVASVEWPSKDKAIVLLDQFPMDQMPPFAKQKFLSDLRSGIDKAKADYKVSGSVEIDLADSATGKTMETVKE